MITTIIEVLPQLQRLAHSRVAAMRAVQRLLAHTNNPDHLDMRSSVLGQWCLQAICSSLRDLRISAGYLVHSKSSNSAILTYRVKANCDGIPKSANRPRRLEEQSRSYDGKA